MMPTAVVITSAVYPRARRGTALGILAGGSAFFAALGPVLGGLLTSIDWRLVFLINVPLAMVTIVVTLRATPALRPRAGQHPRIDYAGTVVFGLAMVALVFGLSQGQSDGWGSLDVVLSLVGALVLLAAFVLIELRVKAPLLEFTCSWPPRERPWPPRCRSRQCLRSYPASRSRGWDWAWCSP